MSRIPLPPYPNGWFAVAHSDELSPGDVKPLHLLGRDFVLFRTDSGAAHVLDAYCPHLGAHLGIGGKVVGETVQCPFHAWRYEGATGRCVEVPYAKKIPARAQVERLPVLERNGLVFAHHHLDGEAPTWEPELIPEVGDPDFVLWGKKEWDIKSHPQEIMENGVDFAHFVTLHGWKVKTIDWQPDGPFYRLKIAVDEEAEDQAATAEQATDVDSFNSGPGFLYTRAVGLMHGIVINCLTPVEPELLRLTHVYYHHKDCPREVYEGFFNAYLHDWDLDIAIWERKIHRLRPTLADGDGHFTQFRKWYRQFYSEDPAATGA
jgi:phenylpropionate dioxygenase-like ring-hydroxylating dioxygenase large terminal subunit